jgi:NADH-quinone oxidoreductase subunit L
MLLWLLVAMPLIAGAALAVAGRRADRVAVVLGPIIAAATVGLAIAAAAARPSVDAPLLAGMRAGLAVDELSALMVITVTGAVLAVLVFATGDARLRTARFVGLMLLFGGAMLITVTATTLVVLLMAWEVMGAASWALIGYWWRETARVSAAHVAFLTTRAADLGLYLAAGAALAGGVGSLALSELGGAESPWLQLLTAGVVVAALGKSAQLPFSFWLSRAMQGPSPVSALLHSATMVAAGAYLLLRLAPLLAETGWASTLVAWVGAATALLLGAVAVAQRDLKQLLAASTCAQIGYMVLAAGVGGVTAGSLQLIAHAATKSLLFLAAGAWLLALGSQQLHELRGAARRYPLVGVTFTIGAASLAGLPPLSLWLGKDAVLAAAEQRSPVLYVVGVAAAVLSTVYSARALWWVWQPASTRPDGQSDGAPVRVPMRVPLLVLATAAAAAGVLAIPLGVGVPAGELAVSAVLAVVVAALTWRFGNRLPAPGPLAGWLGLERAARTVLVRPAMGVAHALARFDDRVLDRAVTAAANGAQQLARQLDRRGEPALDGVVRAVANGARALAQLARRPQTGQLHQYYAQAVAALAVLAVFVVILR